jgi:hypothetical protein
MARKNGSATDVAAAFKRASDRAAKSPYRVVRRIERILRDDIPTFMECPLADEVPGADIVVVGLPYEGVKILDPRRFLPATASHQAAIYSRTGATAAPAAIRRNSIYYSLDHSGGLFPERQRDLRIADHVTVADGGDIQVDYEIEAGLMLHRAGARIERLIGPARILILLGGDDTVPYVGVRSVHRQRKKRIAVLKFDSHFDLAWEPRYWAGSQWARCFEAGHSILRTSPRSGSGAPATRWPGRKRPTSSASPIGRSRTSRNRESRPASNRRSERSPGAPISSISRSISMSWIPPSCRRRNIPIPRADRAAILQACAMIGSGRNQPGSTWRASVPISIQRPGRATGRRCAVEVIGSVAGRGQGRRKPRR